MDASQNGHTSIVQALIESKADLNLQDKVENGERLFNEIYFVSIIGMMNGMLGWKDSFHLRVFARARGHCAGAVARRGRP